MTETPTRTSLPETTPKRAIVVPDKPTLEGLESRRIKRKAGDTYRFARTQAREDVYSIDTPPPRRGSRLDGIEEDP